MLRESFLLEAAASASDVVSVARRAGRPAIARPACLPAPFGAVSSLDVLAAIDDEVLLLIALGGSALRSRGASLASGLFINALGHGLKIEKGFLPEVPSRRRLVHWLGRLVLQLVLHL